MAEKSIEYKIEDYLKLLEENKQLQRDYDMLDASCEVLQLKIKQLKEISRQFKRLEVENKRLKEEFEIESLIENTTGEAFYRSMKLCKLKSCLQEIKEMCKKEVICDDCELQGTNKCDARMCTNFYLNDFAEEILQKISEVIK